jgi:hypothetical protein
MRDTRADVIVFIIMICIMLFSYLYYAAMILGLVMLIIKWISPPEKEEPFMFYREYESEWMKSPEAKKMQKELLESFQKNKTSSATQQKKAPIEKEIKPPTSKPPLKPGWRKRDIGIKPRENRRK